METTELKKLMPTNKADIQGRGVVEFYTPEQVVEILRLLGVVGRSEQFKCGMKESKTGKKCETQCKEYKEIYGYCSI